MGPMGIVGMRLANEMKKTLVKAVNALSACAWRPDSAFSPKTRSGEIEIETNRRPISAALAATLAVKNGWNSGGTIRRKFEPSTLVPLSRG
jgi:hypothetical protein